MSPYKKEIIVGAVMLIITSLFLVDVGTNIVRSESLSFLSLSASTSNFIGWVATICAIGTIVSGLWIITKTSKTADKVFERYTIRATIPGYFLFALAPVILGLLVLLTGQTNWGVGITCLGVPLFLMFVVFALRQNEQSK